MISAIFHALFYNPIYNILIALVAVIPGGDVGIAVILLTVVVRLILLPFSLSAAHTQRAMRALEPKLKEIKEVHKGDKEKEAIATLALYKSERVNPFASIATLFVQLPILLALYWVFIYEPFSSIAALDTARLYAFTPLPHAISPSLFGLLDLHAKSVLLALIAGATQYLQATLALSGQRGSGAPGMQADFARMMGLQMRFVFPVLIAVIAYSTSGAIAIYFITTNLAGALQEWWVRRRFRRLELAQSS